MSAFIVDNTTIDKILSPIFNNNVSQCYIEDLKQILRFNLEVLLYPNLDNYEIMSKIGHSFLLLNYESVNYIYNENNKPENNYTFHFVDCSIIESVKALRCLMYQSCEIPNYAENPIYNVMNDYLNMLMYIIISKLPEYEKAEWG